jgi:hypothetical protein
MTQDILLSIIRAEIYGSPEANITALRWLSIFGKHHDTIGIKAVRRILRKEAHPAWRKVRQETWSKDRTPGLKGFFEDMKYRYWISPSNTYVGSGPAWLVRIRLR